MQAIGPIPFSSNCLDAVVGPLTRRISLQLGTTGRTGDWFKTAGSVLFAVGSLILLVHPARWLVTTWTDPSYDSSGLLVAVLVVALFTWSLSSARVQGQALRWRCAIAILVATALVRLASQLLGINVLGALTLALDVYALAVLLGLSERRRPVAPAWLATLFLMSLPLERVVQRVAGFALQQISANWTCGLLSLGPDAVQCEGVRIVLAGRDVLVDLPCSGARGLLALLTLFFTLACVARPRFPHAVLGVVLVVLAGLLGNTLRVALLALGIAYQAQLGDLNVMAEPWHSGIGLLTLGLSGLVVLLWYRWVGRKKDEAACVETSCQMPAAVSRPALNETSAASDSRQLPRCKRRLAALMGGFGFCVSAGLIAALPPQPVDVSRPFPELALPYELAGQLARPGQLQPREIDYFTRYGGAAARASYGPFALLMVRTSAPLRHLHAPDECLRGAGHLVQYIGLVHGVLPSAIYKSVDPDGNAWRVAVSYQSSDGLTATNVAETVWQWFKAPAADWTMVQRIYPWSMSARARLPFERAVAASLDMSSST